MNPPFAQFGSSLEGDDTLLKNSTDPFQMDTDKGGVDEVHY